MEVSRAWSWIDQLILAVEPNMIRCQAFIVPEDHLTPQVGVLSTLMHSSVWLECFLNIEFILLKHSFDFKLRGGWISEDLIKVSSDSVLLFMELIKINLFNCMDVLGEEFTKHSSTRKNDDKSEIEKCELTCKVY